METAEILLLILILLGLVYYVLSTIALVCHFRRAGSSVPPSPARLVVSILKPVCGVDKDAAGNFKSFICQNYKDYDVLFGVLDETDDSLPVIHSITAGCSHAFLYTGSQIEGANNKVRILDNLVQHARGEILVISDADTRVGPDFLERITASFVDPEVGMVTCLYRGTGDSGYADIIEALHMTCVFAPGVACAYTLGVDFGLGACIAIRRRVLDEIGGFEAIADYLADDYQLGYRTRQNGYTVLLSDYVVDIVLSGETLHSVLARELRWARTTKVSRPGGHLGLVATYGFPYALLFCVLTGFSTNGLVVLGSVMVVRAVTALAGAISMADRTTAKRLHLLPIRDLLSFGVWIASYASRTVRWRGRKLRILDDGRMTPVN